MSATCPHCHHRLPVHAFSGKPTQDYCPVCGMGLKQTAPTVWQMHDSPAPLFARLLARLIDYTLVGILAYLCNWWTGDGFFQGLSWFGDDLFFLPQVQYAIILYVILFAGYFVIFHTLTGQTIGKMSCQIVVLKNGHQLPTLFSNIIREFGIWISFTLGGWPFLVLIFSSRNRGIQDILSKTEVYQQEDQ